MVYIEIRERTVSRRESLINLDIKKYINNNLVQITSTFKIFWRSIYYES